MFASGNTMVDVMYQPYATYFPYHHQRTSSAVHHGSLDAIKKFGVSKLHDPLETSPLAFSSGVGCGSLGSSLGHSHGGVGHSHGSPAGGGTGSPGSPDHGGVAPKEESGSDKERTPHNTQYLSSNCVLVTYFSGDISSNVDEHFSRALSQGSKSNNWKEGSPMSQRNFPPSFWNSAWQPPPSMTLSASSHQDLPGFTADPYSHMTSSLHGMHGSLHNDPWRYPLTSQAYSHHGMHDFAGYSSAMAASSSRFNPHYSSLLPGSRFGSMTGQCDPLSKHTDSWASRYAHTDLTSNLASHHDPHSMTSLHGGLGGGIETAVQDSKDLYWF